VRCLPLEVARRLALEAGGQLCLLQQLCTKVAGHPDKHGFGDCDPHEPSMKWWKSWYGIFITIIFW